MSKKERGAIVLGDRIEPRILSIRGQRVILDSDLAALYGVTAAEKADVVANCDHLARLKFSHSLPYAFTEHGALMAAKYWPFMPAGRRPSRSPSPGHRPSLLHTSHRCRLGVRTKKLPAGSEVMHTLKPDPERLRAGGIGLLPVDVSTELRHQPYEHSQ